MKTLFKHSSKWSDLKTETFENASFSMETPKTESFENAKTKIYPTSSVSKRVRTKEMKTNDKGVMETPKGFKIIRKRSDMKTETFENGVMET